MYYTSKSFSVSIAHNIYLNYESPQTNVHGHNWTITLFFKNCDEYVEGKGMVVDFEPIESYIKGKLDHQYLNSSIENINPTPENIVKWIHDKCEKLLEDSSCYKVELTEETGLEVIYEADR